MLSKEINSPKAVQLTDSNDSGSIAVMKCSWFYSYGCFSTHSRSVVLNLASLESDWAGFQVPPQLIMVFSTTCREFTYLWLGWAGVVHPKKTVKKTGVEADAGWVDSLRVAYQVNYFATFYCSLPFTVCVHWKVKFCKTKH